MIGFINTFLYNLCESQSIKRTHNKSSAEPFFLDCRGLAPFSFSFWFECESYVTTDGESASLSWNKAPIWGLRPDFYYCQTVAGLLIWDALSDERTGLLFTIAAGPRQRSNFRSESRRTRGRILLSQIRDFPFRRLLRLAGSWWRYSTPPPHGKFWFDWFILLIQSWAGTIENLRCPAMDICELHRKHLLRHWFYCSI
jgi:hypothetical protein